MATLQRLTRGSDTQEVRRDLRIDFFTALPPELVLLIISYLELKHLLPCISVSKAWLNILSNMETYWKGACEKLGFSRRMITKLLAFHSTCKNVLYSVLKHRCSITTFSPRKKQFGSGYPYYIHYVCHYAKGHRLVGTTYKDFRPYKILIERIEREGIHTEFTLYPSYPSRAENRIVWAHLQDTYLFLAAASGIWSVYDVKTPPGDLVLQWKAETMYEPGLRLTCCDNCATVCTAKLVTNHLEPSYWEVHVVEISMKHILFHRKKKSTKLPMPKMTAFRLAAKNKEITPRRNSFGKKKISLLSPESNSKDINGGTCSKHLLLIQWANTVLGHPFYYRTEDNALCLSQTPEKKFTVEYDEDDIDLAIMKNHGLNTEFSLNEDKSLIGTIFQSSLVTWELHSTHLSNSVLISLDSYNYEEMKLISLGNIYSIIGLEYSGIMMVVATRTGQIILKCTDFAKQCSQMVPPYIVFYSAVELEWLSDISKPCHTTVAYLNKTNRCIEGVELGEVPPSSDL